MRALRSDGVLAGTALALILAAAPAGTLGAAPDTPAAFEAVVPMPDLPPLPPPTLSDVSAMPATDARGVTGTVTAPAETAAPAAAVAPQTANITPAETVQYRSGSTSSSGSALKTSGRFVVLAACR